MKRTFCSNTAVSLAGLWIALSALALPARAQSPDEPQGAVESPSWTRQLTFNGYGTWYYGKSSNNNQFLGATQEGTYRTANFHLSLSAAVSERLRVVTQVEWLDSEQGDEQGFDYIFAEWKLTPRIRARVGKAKMPFGIYSEFPDAGTLRPFLQLPQSVYGAIGFLGENYKGVGLSGSLNRGRWRAGWDLYGGGTELVEDLTGESFLHGERLASGEEVETEVTRHVIGGRLVVETPLDGLSVGASALTGLENLIDRRRRVYGGQAEYTRGGLTVRAESMHEEVFEDLKSTGSYLEVSYRFLDHWQVAAEAGRLRTEFFGIHPQGELANLTKHDDFSVGLNYWLDEDLVLKLNYLQVRGNLDAHPGVAELPDIVAAGALRSRTNVVLAGAQFSF